MDPEVAARLDAICDTFEQAWKTGAGPEIGAFVTSLVEDDLRRMALPHLVAVDAEYRRARDGAAPSLAEYAALLNVDPGELQQMSEDVSWMTSAAQTPIAGDDHIAAGEGHVGVNVTRDSKIKKPEIDGYEIMSELGRGGMGVVYKAQQIRAGRLVALKTIHAPHLAGSEQIRRFQAEAAAAGRLNHHGIVPVYDVGESSGLHYFSMGFVEGPTLEVKAREQVLSCREAATICRDLAEALEYAHRNGVVHRDVKPHNVLIGTDGKPRLTDFGLAKLIDENQDLTSTGQVLGTAAYMAPEQARGIRSVVEPTIDVYSLGATLYRCVTGRPPFQANTTIEVLRQLNEDEPVSPRRLNQEVDFEIETLCLKCLDKEPVRRFQTAGELAAELSRYLNHEPIHSRRIGVLNRTWRWCRRKPAIAGVVGLGLLLLFAIAGGVPYVLLREHEFEISQLQSQLTADALKVSQDAHAIAELKSQQAEERAASSAARAATQEYYASILQIREQRLLPDPELGWTWKALESLQKIAASDADGKDPVVLRSLIADALTTPDMREIGRIENVPNTASMAVSHDGKLLAAGDWAGNPSQVRIYRINIMRSPAGELKVEFELAQTCSVDTTADFFVNEILEKVYPQRTLRREGMWAVNFSPDDKQIAVGTRNGNIILWQIDSNPPTKVFEKRYAEKSIDQIEFSADGALIYAQYRQPEVFRKLDVQTHKDTVFFDGQIRAFQKLDDRNALFVLSDFVTRCTLDRIEHSIELSRAKDALCFSIGENLTTAVLGTGPIILCDAKNGRGIASLESQDSDRPKFVELSRDATLVIGGKHPQNLVIWDAWSGKELLNASYLGGEVPRVCLGNESNRFYMYSVSEIMAYELRGIAATPKKAQPSGLLTVADPPISISYASRQILREFDIRDDLQRMAFLESSSLPANSKASTGPWTYAELIDQSNGAIIENWTCLSLEDAPRSRFTDGESIVALPNGEGVAFTSASPGNVVIADRKGFRFPGGIGLNVSSQSVDSVADNLLRWSGMTVTEHSGPHGNRAAVALRMPFAFSRPDQRLVLRARYGEHVEEYSLGADCIDVSGWYLFSLGELPGSVGGDWDVEAELVNVDAKFRKFDTDVGQLYDRVVPGQLFLLPWQQMKRGNTTSMFPLRLGPICLRRDGGLAAVVESWTLYQWDAELKSAHPEYWRDFDNSEEDMHGLVATDGGVVVGTDSGLVAVVHEDGQATFLEKARTETAAYDSRDGVTAIAVNDRSKIVVAGNLRGQIRLFELPAGRGIPAFVTDAHPSQIVALAITENANLLASADAEGALKFWKRHSDRLELLFEMTANRTPIHSMKFSEDGDLYLLRQENRGVMRLELDELAAHFTNLGLQLPE